MLHAHIETHATDCDGSISRDYVMAMDEAELSSQLGDFEFHNRVVASVVNTYASFRGGQLTVSVDDEYGSVSLSWSEQTEEGSRQTEARFCSDNCDEAVSHYRDHRAEAAGY